MAGEESSNEASQYTELGLKAGLWLGVALHLLLALFTILAFCFPPLGIFFGLSAAVVALIGKVLLVTLGASFILGLMLADVKPELGLIVILGLNFLGAVALTLVGGLIGGVVDIIRANVRCCKPSIDESAGENSLMQEETSALLKTNNAELHQGLGNASENKDQVSSADQLKDEAVQEKSPVVGTDTPAPQPAAEQPPASLPAFGSSASF